MTSTYKTVIDLRRMMASQDVKLLKASMKSIPHKTVQWYKEQQALLEVAEKVAKLYDGMPDKIE